jgi:predicted HAD superfamily Cof-like phosphohydrolase
MTNFDLVAMVYSKFGLPTWQERPAGVLPDDEFLLRYDLMAEELHEVLKAHRARDLEKFADGLADLLFVVYGTAHAAGIPIDRVFTEVTRANMAKERSNGDADPRSPRKSSLDLVKPGRRKVPLT